MVKFLGPYFIKPILKEEVYPDFSMFQELEKIFSNISPKSLVRGALYMWNKDTGLNKSGYRDKWKDVSGNPLFVTDAFLEKTRDCDTQIILDNYSSENHKKTLRHLAVTLGTNIIIDPRTGENDPEYRRLLAEQKLIAKSGYMHDKFFIISEVKGLGSWVIIQLTANINITQCHQFNNMMVIYDDKELFDKYLEHWNNLKDNIEARTKDEKASVSNVFANLSVEINEEDPVSVFFFPRKRCPIEAELERVLEDSPSSRIRIDVAMAYLTRPSFRRLLAALRHKGCKIRVLLSEEYQNERSTIEYLKLNKVPTRIIKNRSYNLGTWEDEEGNRRINDNWQARMHHKFVLINKCFKRVTWTGSYNLTIPGLKFNDESVLRITDAGVFRRYRKMFNLLWYPEGILKKIF